MHLSSFGFESYDDKTPQTFKLMSAPVREKLKPRLTFSLGLVLIAFRTTRPCSLDYKASSGIQNFRMIFVETCSEQHLVFLHCFKDVCERCLSDTGSENKL